MQTNTPWQNPYKSFFWGPISMTLTMPPLFTHSPYLPRTGCDGAFWHSDRYSVYTVEQHAYLVEADGIERKAQSSSPTPEVKKVHTATTCTGVCSMSCLRQLMQAGSNWWLSQRSHEERSQGRDLTWEPSAEWPPLIGILRRDWDAQLQMSFYRSMKEFDKMFCGFMSLED